ncbi:MAG: cytochrome c [Alphaproteobacteria bacterium]|nr:cytochrome c [Alphaproteobacteria bacterium]
MPVIAWLSGIVIAVVVAVIVYFFAGFYNVSALRPGNSVMSSALESIREASVERHAEATPPAGLDDASMVQAGAHEFVEEGCVMCHGSPGVKPAKFEQGLDPQPPGVDDIGQDMSAAEVFWIIHNGIRMTAMPAFGGHTSSDEQWKLVSYIRHIRQVTPQQFATWNADMHPPAPREGEKPDSDRD